MVSCGSLGNDPTSQPDPEQETTGETIQVVSSYITVTSIEEMVRKASTIVVGNVVRVAGHRNLARDPLDISRVDDRAEGVTGVGTIYEVKAERYLKGDLGATILVTQSEGFLPYRSPINLAPEVIATAQAIEHFTPLGIGARYIFFLEQGGYFPELQFGIAEPYRFRLENGQAVVESSWQGAASIFPPGDEQKMLQQVETELTK